MFLNSTAWFWDWMTVLPHLDEHLLFCHFQALEFFLRAEEGKTAHFNTGKLRDFFESTDGTQHCYYLYPVDPNFYSKNLLMLGKTYMAMKDKEKALLWLRKAKDYPARTLEDKEVHTAAPSNCWWVSVWMWQWVYVCVYRPTKKLLSCWRSWDEVKHDAFKVVLEVVFHWFFRYPAEQNTGIIVTNFFMPVIQNKPATSTLR